MMNLALGKEQLFNLLIERGCSPKVINIMRKIPRENFVLTKEHDLAYADSALAIDCEQTISQPYVVATMTELLLTQGKLGKVLEIGTGSGYQAAILSYIADAIYTIERYKLLYEQAKVKLKNYNNVYCIHGDGNEGAIQFAPYDGIIITAAVSEFPAKLFSQMGEICISVYPEQYDNYQRLTVLYKNKDQFFKQYHGDVSFVPMLSGIV